MRLVVIFFSRNAIQNPWNFQDDTHTWLRSNVVQYRYFLFWFTLSFYLPSPSPSPLSSSLSSTFVSRVSIIIGILLYKIKRCRDQQLSLCWSFFWRSTLSVSLSRRRMSEARFHPPSRMDSKWRRATTHRPRRRTNHQKMLSPTTRWQKRQVTQWLCCPPFQMPPTRRIWSRAPSAATISKLPAKANQSRRNSRMKILSESFSGVRM